MRKALAKDRIITSLVFFRMKRGKPAEIKSIRGSWETARRNAGHPGALVHAFRRTVVRDLDRAGVPQKVQMALVGHKTPSINLRYRIADESDKRDAVAKLDAFRAASSKESRTPRRARGRR